LGIPGTGLHYEVNEVLEHVQTLDRR
jgi:hypothetical protein